MIFIFGYRNLPLYEPVKGNGHWWNDHVSPYFPLQQRV
jgi:hypothetical protein